MNNLIINDNWFKSNLADQPKSIQQFLMPLLKLQDKKIDHQHIVKWKTCNANNQLVIQTNNYYYKIYESTLANTFYHIIRQELCRIYREEYGLIWDLFVYKNEKTGNVIQIERRQKLRIPTEDDMTFDELLINFSKILNKVEKKLNLKYILSQIKMYNQCKDVEKIKLIRKCGNKYNDYGITDNGQIILLDDADWFLVLLDNKNNILHKKTIVLPITDLNNQNMYFCSDRILEDLNNQTCGHVFFDENSYSFSFIYEKYTNGKTIQILNKQAEIQMQHNINILCNNIQLKNNS